MCKWMASKTEDNQEDYFERVIYTLVSIQITTVH